ncbi:hypothetical protein M3P21_14765 [Ruegeria sp. 2012CJ41-6]|uniref:Uncharacterized protein n=1 Tax=Ruegeria spongiae TaxID=2942209 RepID=A0ABT0Q4M7_9RHOB|nr:hypothetical protein [Ruegeria spongiae]MCL6284796.1 hypothetical protein [Ruegeria spongiae]
MSSNRHDIEHEIRALRKQRAVKRPLHERAFTRWQNAMKLEADFEKSLQGASLASELFGSDFRLLDRECRDLDFEIEALQVKLLEYASPISGERH